MIVLRSERVLRLGYWATDPAYPTWTAPLEAASPHNSPSKSCFSIPREKRGILISSSYSPYDLISLGHIPIIRVYPPKARLWRFSDQSVPLFNFGNFLVPHVQRLDGVLTVDGLSWNTSGKTLARNFCAIINNLSNQLLFTFISRIILEPVHWTYLSLSLSHSPVCIYKYKNLVREPLLTPVSLPELSSAFIPTLQNFLYKTS